MIGKASRIHFGGEKYWSIFSTQVAAQFAYWGDLATHSLSIVMFMFIFFHLWKTTYQSVGSGLQAISGLTLRETLWYLMLAEVIVLSKPSLSRSVSQAVKDGSIAYLLNKPYHFLLYQFSIAMGESLVHMLFNILAGGVMAWFLVGPPPNPRGWPLVLLAMLIALLIDFCINAMIGLAAFITEEVSAFEWIYQKFLFLLGGLLIPLDFFPGWLRSIAGVLPFAYTVYGPARLFVDPTWMRFANLLFGQICWLAGLALLLHFLYNKGVHWLTINGG